MTARKPYGVQVSASPKEARLVLACIEGVTDLLSFKQRLLWAIEEEHKSVYGGMNFDEEEPRA